MSGLQPLAGCRIVDLTHEWAGPHAARLMADFGAEVIKVEYFRRLDHMRGASKVSRAYDRHARFRQLNRNKRSLALDLRDERDRQTFEGLVGRSDIVLSNSRPGVLERLGYGVDELKRLKTDIILILLSACGQTGPDAGYAGYGGGLEATSGIQSLTAYGPGQPPRRIREMDVTNGIVGAAAIVTALFHRASTGLGSVVDLSEIEAPLHALAGDSVIEAARGGGRPTLGNRSEANAPHGVYPCFGDDAWIAISVDSEREWLSLCGVMCADWANDRRFGTRAGRLRRHDDLDELISRWTREREKMEAMDVLQRAGVRAGAVLDSADLFSNAHLASRNYFRRPARAPNDPLFSGFPFSLSVGGGEVCTAGPSLGEANRYVVCDLLGRAESHVRELREDEIGTDFDV